MIITIVIAATYDIMTIMMIITTIAVMTIILRHITMICISPIIIIAYGKFTLQTHCCSTMTMSRMATSLASEQVFGDIMASLLEEGSLLHPNTMMV